MMGFWQIIGAGWRGAFGAMRNNASLFCVAFGALLLVQCLIQILMPPSPPGIGQSPFSGALIIRGVFQTILNDLCVAPCMVAVHRFVLIRESGSVLADKKRLGVFVIILIVLQLLPLGLLCLIFISPFLGIFVLLSTWISVKLVLAFPAIALDRPNPLRDSWYRTAKRWWYVFGILFFGLIALSIPSEALKICFSPAFNSAIQSPASLPIYLFGISIVAIAYPVVAAALASELFKKFGGMDNQPLI